MYVHKKSIKKMRSLFNNPDFQTELCEPDKQPQLAYLLKVYEMLNFSEKHNFEDFSFVSEENKKIFENILSNNHWDVLIESKRESWMRGFSNNLTTFDELKSVESRFDPTKNRFDFLMFSTNKTMDDWIEYLCDENHPHNSLYKSPLECVRNLLFSADFHFEWKEGFLVQKNQPFPFCAPSSYLDPEFKKTIFPFKKEVLGLVNNHYFNCFMDYVALQSEIYKDFYPDMGGIAMLKARSEKKSQPTTTPINLKKTRGILKNLPENVDISYVETIIEFCEIALKSPESDRMVIENILNNLENKFGINSSNLTKKRFQ